MSIVVCLNRLVGLEQTVQSQPLPQYAFPRRCCLVLGAERTGIPPQVSISDMHLSACARMALLTIASSFFLSACGTSGSGYCQPFALTACMQALQLMHCSMHVCPQANECVHS